MTNLVKHIFVFAISVHMTFATKIGCGGNAYDTSNWDNDAFRYYFLPSNIENTLYCIGFDKNRLTKNDESTTTLNAAGGSIHRSLLSFEHLDEETNLLYFRETFYLVLYNEQLLSYHWSQSAVRHLETCSGLLSSWQVLFSSELEIHNSLKSNTVSLILKDPTDF